MAGTQTSKDMDEHKKLASIVKNIHANLRKKLRASNGDFEAVWEEHCQNQSVLSEYAQAMKTLAKEHWTKNSHTRIDWCRDTIKEYFQGRGLKKVLEKEKKRRLREYNTKAQQMGAVSHPDDTALLECGDQPHTVREQFHFIGGTGGSSCDSVSHDFGFEEETRNQPETSHENWNCFNTENGIPLPGQRIRLLDVGSCYNPFQDCEDFLSVAVDISPATESVHRCDFLRLNVTPAMWRASDARSDRMDEKLQQEMDDSLQSLTGPVHSLPASSFHVVVFCLLLEYLPAPFQRWLCCLQASRLLQPNGLLVIVTPDSHSQHRNAPMIRSWKTAIEALGFSRWRYVKQDHLHCMAFRKLHHLHPDTQTHSTSVLPTERHQGAPGNDVDLQHVVGYGQQKSDAPGSTSDVLHSCPQSNPPTDSSFNQDSQSSPTFDPLLSRGLLCQDELAAKFSHMMYIPQDVSHTLATEDEEDENKNEDGFEGDEDRQQFFSAVDYELPGFASSEED